MTEISDATGAGKELAALESHQESKYRQRVSELWLPGSCRLGRDSNEPYRGFCHGTPLDRDVHDRLERSVFPIETLSTERNRLSGFHPEKMPEIRTTPRKHP